LLSSTLVWLIAAIVIAALLFRPKDWSEAVWSCSGAALLVALRLISFPQALNAIGKGLDVYLFLTGMMLMSDLVRREGVFDWLASIAVERARGSRLRLFTLIFSVGILVTVFLSNDATAVVLTPAVYAAVKKARTEPLPHLFACAFIANAASFVLPISNPANLVVYGKSMPPLIAWLRLFALPSVLSIGATYAALMLLFRRDLRGSIPADGISNKLLPEGRRAAWGILVTGAVLMASSALGHDLGLPTCVASVCAVVWATRASRRAIVELVREIPWSVIPLVAGLFVVVEALNGAGALDQVDRGLKALVQLARIPAALSASFGIALLCVRCTCQTFCATRYWLV
jgi:arsenical pump membrane protein